MTEEMNRTELAQGQTCATCSAPQVFLHPDGQLRHCFACGVTVHETALMGPPAVMQDIFRSSHRHLLESDDVLRSLLDGRGLHRQVLVDSMVGLIPPDLDVTQLSMPQLETAEAELDAITARPRGRGRPSKEEEAVLSAATNRVKGLKQAREQLLMLEQLGNQLVFFYTNTGHEIVRLRVEPSNGAGESAVVRLGHSFGVFNHALFAPGLRARSLNALQGRSIVVLSEWDLLQLQSLGARLAVAESLLPHAGYLKVAAVGPTEVDASMIRTLGRLPLIVRNSANQRASGAMVESIRQQVNAFEITVPGVKTLEALVQGDDNMARRHALLQLAESQTLVTRPFSAVAAEIDNWRSLEERQAKKFEADRWASGVLVSDISERGQLFYDGRQAYVFETESKRLLPVDRENADTALFLNQYGIAPTDGFSKHALSAISVRAQTHGTRTKVHSLSHYDKEANRLYVFNHDRHIYRITKSRIELLDNGTDGVLFVRNPNYEPFEIGVPKGKPQLLAEMLLGSMQLREQALSRTEQENLFTHWLYAMFFPELFPTRPILAVIGEKGSGKTSILRRLGQLLFGSGFQVMGLSNEQRDFDAAVTGEGFVAVDNADADVPWLNDRLAVVATGGTLKRRELYTTNSLVEFPITAFVGITSRTPHFKREDVADRLLLFHIDRLKGFESEAVLLARLLAQRNSVMTELVGELQRVLAAFERNKGKSYRTNFRIADFGEFVLKIADAQGTLAAAEATFERLGQAQLAFSVQDDPVIDVLESWVCAPGNAGRQLTTGQLFLELKNHAACSNPQQLFEFRHAVGFGGYLESKKATLAAIFKATDDTLGSRRRVWRFYPPADVEGMEVREIKDDGPSDELMQLMEGMKYWRPQ